jgi:hypothetical protein
MTLSSCESFLEVDLPKSKVASELVFSDDVTATSAIIGIYHDMINAGPSFANGSFQSVTALSGLSADELSVFNKLTFNLVEFEKNAVTAENEYALSLWTSMYKTIYQSNAVIEGLNNSQAVSSAVKNQLRGEALFVRAFTHFYLVNLFGDVPLITTTDYTKNASVSRTPAATVYEQIVDDLILAQGLLNEEYLTIEDDFVTKSRARPNKYAAAALLARVYLYMEDWQNAETQATQVISNTSMYELITEVDQVFLISTKEAIWQLRPVAPNYNTLEGADFIIPIGSAPRYYELKDQLLDAFEADDKRLASWVSNIDTLYFPFKYKIQQGSTLTEYSMVLRLGEQYLIRAEARAQLDNISGAQDDLNMIRDRAGLDDTPANDKALLLLAIENERHVELFTEWGHRWLDLKRTGRADAVLGPIKSDWAPGDQFYPIPQSEINKNPNLK